ncbi:MAG: hypothetical protein AAF721_26545 [Myxococcota bacterium]
MLRRRGAAIALSLLVPLASAPASAATSVSLLMRGPTMTPEKAAALRIAPQTNGRGMIDAGDAAGAGVAYDLAASEHGDPVLYLDAGDAYVIAAEADENVELCDVAVERAAIALDLLYFSIDDAADSKFRLVETSDVPDLIARAQALQDTAEETRERILAAKDSPVASAAAPKKERKKGNGKWMKIGGIGLASVGGALTVMGVVGLGMGAFNQARADDPGIYGPDYDEVEVKGERANLIAGLGFGFGGAAAIAGVTLYLVGRSRAKKAGAGGDKEEKPIENDDPVVRIAPTLNGMAVSGRF